MEHETRGVHVSAGDGIVAHVENLTAYAAGDESRLNELLVRINALAGAPWQEIVRTLTADIAEADYNDHPKLACVSVESDRVAALVFGDTSLSITIDGAETVLDGRDSSTWIDVALRGSVDRVHAGAQSKSAVVGVLRDGVVPAGGFLLDTAGPMPASGRWSEMASANAQAEAAAEAEVALTEAEAEEPVAAAPKAPAHAAPARPVIAQTPVLEEAVAEEPAVEEPAVEEAVAEEPAVEEAVAEEPAVEEAVAEEPAVEEAVAEEAVAEDSTPASPKAARGMFARIEELGRKDAVPSNDAATSDTSGQHLFGSSPFDGTEPANNGTNSATPTASPGMEHEAQQGTTLAPERPQIRGVLCPTGHLTAPNETLCRTCRATIAADAATVNGDRPVLGVLTFDDGAILNVDRPAAIGSNVPTGYAVEAEPATIVRLDDGAGGVSDVQVEVRLSGWNVEIIDMQSTNGTYTSLNGERQTRTKLRPGQRVSLQHDMTIETGGRSFVYTLGPGPR